MPFVVGQSGEIDGFSHSSSPLAFANVVTWAHSMKFAGAAGYWSPPRKSSEMPGEMLHERRMSRKTRVRAPRRAFIQGRRCVPAPVAEVRNRDRLYRRRETRGIETPAFLHSFSAVGIGNATATRASPRASRSAWYCGDIAVAHRTCFG